MNMRVIHMNDDIENLNKENEKINNYVSPGNQSKAAFSNITTPDEDKRMSVAQGIIEDQARQSEDIDVIKKTITEMGNRVNQLTQVINQLVNGQSVQTQGATAQTPQQGLNMESISQLGDLLEKGITAYKSFKGNSDAPQPLIDQNMINERMKQSFLDELDTGASITRFIKDSLKKKVTREVINTSFKDMGNAAHDPK